MTNTLDLLTQTYIWTIAATLKPKNELICNGYIKSNYNKATPWEIIELCATYYSYEGTTMKSLQDAKHGEYFDSPMFCMHTFKWYLRIYAHGRSSSRTNISCELNLVSLPPKLGYVSIKIKQYLSELNIFHLFNEMTVDCRTNHTSFKWNLAPSAISIQDSKSLNIGVYITLLDVYDPYGELLTSNYISPKSLVTNKSDSHKPATDTYTLEIFEHPNADPFHEKLCIGFMRNVSVIFDDKINHDIIDLCAVYCSNNWCTVHMMKQ
eukprot:188413_1